MKLEFTKEDVIKIISLMQAVVDGKTIQAPNGNGGWIDVEEVLVNDLLYYYNTYRIKPEPKYNLELTTEELDVVKSSLSAFMIAKINNSAQKLCRNILDNINRIEENCPDILCDDCTKECEMKKIMKQANEGLDFDKIADEVEQDIKEQSEEVTIASVWEKRDEVPLELKISEIYTKGNPTIKGQKEDNMNKTNPKAINVYVLNYWDDEDNRWEIDKVTSNNEEALKWDSRGQDYCFNGYSVEVEELNQLAKAKDLLKKMYYLYHDPCVTNKDLENRDKLFEEVKTFLKEIEK